MFDMWYYKWQQNREIKNISPDISTLIVYLVDSHNGINGGYISIFSMCHESRMLLANNDRGVVMSTYPGISYTCTRYTKFDNNEFIFRFKLLTQYFKSVKHLVIHVPEYWSMNLLTHLSETEKNWLKQINTVHINILNQNIEQMPEPDEIKKLYDLSSIVTMTTAQPAYSTEEYQQRYGIPLHLVGTYVTSEDYYFVPYEEKKNVIVYSPDRHPLKDVILEMLRDKAKQYELIEIRNMTYSEYKTLISQSKFAITFGEGFDNYFGEPFFSGSISFSVYNEVFFPSKEFHTQAVFDSYEDMHLRLIDQLERFDQPGTYQCVQNETYLLLKNFCDVNAYRKRLHQFYIDKCKLDV